MKYFILILMVSGSVFTILGLLFPLYYLFTFKFKEDFYVCNNLTMGIMFTLTALLFTFFNDLHLKNK